MRIQEPATITDVRTVRAARSVRRAACALAVALAAGGVACATARTAAEPSAGAVSPDCAAPHVVVRNDTRGAVDVYAERGSRRELIATVFPGRTELPIDASDRRFVAFSTNADATNHGFAHPVAFSVVCRGGPTDTR